MKYNYHTHTFRCHHAGGTEEEYVLCAIEGGLAHMGFSDHFPFRFPNGQETGHRVPVAEASAYIDTVYALREKYKEQIDIHCGFEMEYYPEFFEEMVKNAVDYGAEYLILGQHFLKAECYPDVLHATRETDDPTHLAAYVSLVTQGIKTGKFTYVAHPDIFSFVGDPTLYHEEMRKICVTARECDTPLEINFLGIRTGRFYPHEEFWQVAGEEGAPVVFGFDAHEVCDAYDDRSLAEAQRLVDTYHLNFVENVKLKPLR